MAGHDAPPRRPTLLDRWLPFAAARRERRLQERLAEAAQQLSWSEARCAQVLEAVPDGICLSRDGRVAYANVALAKLVGLADPREAIGRPTLDFVEAGFHDPIRQGRANAVENVLYGPTEIQLHHVDGSRVPAELRVVALEDGEGRSFLNVVRDVTARKDAEAAARLRATALEQATDGVIIANETGRIVYVNRAFCEMRGYEPGELLGCPAVEVFAALGVENLDVTGIVDGLLAGASWSGRYTFIDADGEHHRDTRCFAVRGTGGGVHSIVALVRDITSDVRLEQRAEQDRRLEALAQLASGLARDVDDLLGVILGEVEHLAAGSQGSPEVQRHARTIAEAAERSAAIMRRLLGFGRRRALRPRLVDVSTLVRDRRRLLAELLPGRIALRLDLAPSLPPVRIDPGALQQMLVELVTNARDAIPAEGTIRVLTRGAASGVVLAVEDDGEGMDADTRRRALEPYFTTRTGGAGLGLGLATAHGLVRESGGHLELESDPGRGTRVRILLPEAGPTVAPVAASEPAAGEADGRETLLLVEPEGRLRSLARRTLVQAGYRVLEAADAAEALSIATAEPGSIDLIVCDTDLPDPDGLERVLRLRGERPGLPVLLTSGSGPGEGGREHLPRPDALLLQKPFRMGELRAFVRDALDAAAER